MKLLILSNMYPSEQKPYAGIYVKNIYEALVMDQSLDVSLLTMPRTYTRLIGSLLKYLGFCFRYLKYLPRKYDIVHLHFFFPLIFITNIYKLFHPSTKIIVTYHGTDIEAHGNSRISRAIFRLSAKAVSHHIAVGKDLSATIKDKLLVKNIDIVPAGVNENIFFHMPETSKIFDFIFVGSFFEAKGVPELIDAIKILNDESIKFCFVGSGPLMPDLLALKEKYDVSIMQNQTQEQLRVLYNQSRFLILPSKRESFGLVVTEAMYCGIPAIVSPVGGLTEQVTSGYNGIIIDSVTGPEIFDGLNTAISFIQNNERQMSENALKSNKEFSLAKVCDYHLKIYQDLYDAQE